MNDDIEFLYIGWVYVKSESGSNHDKVWTAFKAGGNYYAGWGARGKSIRFKKHPNYNSLLKVQTQKEKKYTEVDELQLFTAFPTFKEDAARDLTFSILTNKVM